MKAYFKAKNSFAAEVTFNKKKLYGPFLWVGFNCFKTTGPLRGGSLLFITKSPVIPGTHFIDLGRMKG